MAIVGRLKIVQPETTQNYSPNSSFERWNPSTLIPYDWNRTVASGTITEKTDDVRFGASSMRILNAVVASGVGMYQNISGFTAGESVTVSAFAKVTVGKAQLLVQNSGGSSTISTSEVTALSTWTRMESTITVPAGGVIRVMLLSYGTNADVLFDGIQVERKAYATSYVDGSLKGGYFIGEAHRSSSIRTAFGGRIKNLETDINTQIDVSYLTGMGAVNPNVITDDYGTLDGAYTNAVVLPKREFSIGINLHGTTLDTLQANRNALIKAVQTVRTPLQPHFIRYTNSSSVEKEIGGYYSGGLEGELDGSLMDKAYLGFIAPDPYFRSPYDSAKQLGYTQAVTATGILIKDNNDNYFTFAGSVTGAINAFAYNPLNPDEVYLVGSFTTINGVAAKSVAKYTISTNTISAMGQGLGDIINSVAVDVNGDVYVGGIFTTDGSGTSMKRIAKFAYGGTLWQTVGAGTGGGFSSGNVYSLKFDNFRNLFIAGTFTATTSATAVAGIAKVLVSTNTIIVAVTGLTTTEVRSIDFSVDNTLYLGGQFTFTGGSNIARVVNGSTTPVVMGNSLNSNVYKVYYDKRTNLLYVGGQFTASGSVTVRRLGYWNGVTFTEIGGGFNSNGVDQIVVDNKGNLIVSGSYTALNTPLFTTTQLILKWNGSYWSQLDTELITFQTAVFLGTTPNGYLAIGTFSGATVLNTNVHTTVTNNGNAPSTATFKFVGTGKLQSIKNLTTGQFIDLNYTMATGEVVYLVLDIGRIVAISNLYGDITNFIFLPGYNAEPFFLNSGDNDIAVFISGTTVTGTTDARIIFRDTYYSAD